MSGYNVLYLKSDFTVIGCGYTIMEPTDEQAVAEGIKVPSKIPFPLSMCSTTSSSGEFLGFYEYSKSKKEIVSRLPKKDLQKSYRKMDEKTKEKIRKPKSKKKYSLKAQK